MQLYIRSDEGIYEKGKMYMNDHTSNGLKYEEIVVLDKEEMGRKL